MKIEMGMVELELVCIELALFYDEYMNKTKRILAK